jgi:hypothetical protein
MRRLRGGGNPKTLPRIDADDRGSRRFPLLYSPYIRYTAIGMEHLSQLRNGKPLRFVFGHFATLCLISQPIGMGTNGDVLDKGLCLQHRRLGINGEELRKSFRNGDRGRG